MGLTFVAVQVHGKNGKAETFNLLMDTGSVYTWIESDSLLRLGIEPRVEKRKFRTIEGREISRSVGEAKLEVDGERATSIVVFAEQGDAYVLGVYSLEGLGFEIDPVAKKLKRLETFAAY
jgi:predicted aspartyl protease